MEWTFLIPLAIGISGILQGALNLKMSDSLGLVHSLLIGNFLVLVYTVIIYFFVVKSPESVPDFFRIKAPITSFKWWYVIPSVFGLMIISGIPIGIYRLGAVKVTVLIVVAQMVTSISWDIFVDKIPMNTMKVLGLFFSIIAVACTLYS